MSKQLLFLLIMTGICCISSCYYDKEELLYPGGSDCQTTNNAFASSVNPIIQSKCANAPECHAAGSTNTGGPLTNYTQIKNMSPVIRGQVISGLMPKTGSLTASEHQSIICWIDSGAPNN